MKLDQILVVSFGHPSSAIWLLYNFSKRPPWNWNLDKMGIILNYTQKIALTRFVRPKNCEIVFRFFFFFIITNNLKLSLHHQICRQCVFCIWTNPILCNVLNCKYVCLFLYDFVQRPVMTNSSCGQTIQKWKSSI